MYLDILYFVVVNLSQNTGKQCLLGGSEYLEKYQIILNIIFPLKSVTLFSDRDNSYANFKFWSDLIYI